MDGQLEPQLNTRENDAEDHNDEDLAIRRLGDAVHHVNLAVMKAVEAGLTVELVRVSRYHGGNGTWGDQMVPIVRVKG